MGCNFNHSSSVYSGQVDFFLGKASDWAGRVEGADGGGSDLTPRAEASCEILERVREELRPPSELRPKEGMSVSGSPRPVGVDGGGVDSSDDGSLYSMCWGDSSLAEAVVIEEEEDFGW